jgi:predicted nucleic acid-binding protein
LTLVDANVLMYAAGRQHPGKGPSAELLERIALGGVDAAIDAEVPQELLHRCRAIGRWPEGSRVYQHARVVFESVLPITADIVDQARRLLDEYSGITARDALHASVVLVHGLDALCSYDAGFDQVAAVSRVTPEELLR